MATKSKKKGGTPELAGVSGPGVSPLSLPALDKFISKSETQKAKRCAESPGELAAKKELKFAMHQNKASLPVNAEGISFYRSTEYEKDYLLEEKLVAKKYGDDESDDD